MTIADGEDFMGPGGFDSGFALMSLAFQSYVFREDDAQGIDNTAE